MLEVKFSKLFKKDLKLAEKQGRRTKLLFEIIDLLAAQKLLPPNNRDHKLKNSAFRECHILPDWLLIYHVVGKQLILRRAGTHSDLF